MPTARELLDQADALMRRNRLGTPAAPPAPASDEGIPTLLDVVKVAQDEPPTPSLARAAPTDLEDVPLLTDAVEEIEASSVLDEPDTADASMWSDTLTGVHSILGDEPPAAKAQPPAAAAVPASAPSKSPLHLVASDAVLDTAGDAATQTAPPSAEADVDAVPVESIDIPPPPDETAEPAADRSFEEPAVALPPPPEAEPWPLPEAIAAQPIDEATPAQEPIDISEPLLETIEAPRADDTVRMAETEEAAEAAEDRVAAAAAPQPAAADDDARWTALAEEIRMQVLQRIDLFTDTGLREQLAVRLQPIVDRASADLVATINQHVGILLRAYVAEAIEREIERWRTQGH